MAGALIALSHALVVRGGLKLQRGPSAAAASSGHLLEQRLEGGVPEACRVVSRSSANTPRGPESDLGGQ